MCVCMCVCVCVYTYTIHREYIPISNYTLTHVSITCTDQEWWRSILDCIASNEGALYAVYTHWMVYSLRACTLPTPLIVTLCSVLLLQTVCITPGKAELRSWPPSNVPLRIYSVWVSGNITMYTDEGTWFWTVSLELQGDIEGSCELTETRHIWDYSKR